MSSTTHKARVTIEYDIEVAFADDGKTDLRDQAYDHAHDAVPLAIVNCANILVGDVQECAK